MELKNVIKILHDHVLNPKKNYRQIITYPYDKYI